MFMQVCRGSNSDGLLGKHSWTNDTRRNRYVHVSYGIMHTYIYIYIYTCICIYMALQNYLDSITTQRSLICTYRIYSTKFLRCKILEDFSKIIFVDAVNVMPNVHNYVKIFAG